MKILDLYEEANSILKSLPNRFHFFGSLALITALISSISGHSVIIQGILSIITALSSFVIMDYLNKKDEKLSLSKLTEPSITKTLPSLVNYFLTILALTLLLSFLFIFIIMLVLVRLSGIKEINADTIISQPTTSIILLSLILLVALIIKISLIPFSLSIYIIFDKSKQNIKTPIRQILTKSRLLTKGFRFKILLVDFVYFIISIIPTLVVGFARSDLLYFIGVFLIQALLYPYYLIVRIVLYQKIKALKS